MSTTLVKLAFEKAREEIGSDKKTRLARHLSDLLQDVYGYTVGERTLRDYYTKVESGTMGPQDDLKPKLIACFCNYLGYRDYAEFVQKYPETTRKGKDFIGAGGIRVKKSKKRKWSLVITISIVFGTILLFGLYKWGSTSNDSSLEQSAMCMAWSDSLYVKVSCNRGPLSSLGTEVVPYQEYTFRNLKKVQVDAAYPFFNEKDEPLLWYYKNNDNEIEYFTAPGLHPITGKTLKAITPYIVQKYVPMHTYESDSFIE